MTENRFWNLLAKKMAKEASEEDLHELELLIKKQSLLDLSGGSTGKSLET